VEDLCYERRRARPVWPVWEMCSFISFIHERGFVYLNEHEECGLDCRYFLRFQHGHQG
jgi:hypothetical protein